MDKRQRSEPGRLWAEFRHAVIGPLIAVTIARGALRGEIERLAEKVWIHPVSADPVKFAFSTIERWYYQARSAPVDPMARLGSKRRSDAGTSRAISVALADRIDSQYRQHPGWTVQLHVDNLAVQLGEDETMPSYSTILRYMRRRGWYRVRPAHTIDTEGARRARQRFRQCEVRSYEAAQAHALWHLDYHVSSRAIATASGKMVKPHLLAVIDDHSRLICHAQWYWTESAETLAHGLAQAFQKRALPHSLMTDNGAAMRAAETRAGLAELDIEHCRTLAYSAYQNAKIEAFWGQVEGRLIAMLEGVDDLTLDQLNLYTLAWVEQEYQHSRHEEIAASPMERYLGAVNVGRQSPDAKDLRQRFRRHARPRLRRSDGTVSIARHRFEVPSAYHHLDTIAVRFAAWDLSYVHIYDERERRVLGRIFPLDRNANADGRRRRRSTALADPELESTESAGVAPLLTRYLHEYQRPGLPPALVAHTPASAGTARHAVHDDDDHRNDDNETNGGKHR